MSKKKEWRGTAFAKKPAVIATEIALAMMASQYAYAQAVQTAERVERVEITGTRIPQLSVEGTSPVTVMNAQDITFSGLNKPEDLLNSLPQVSPSYGVNNSNGATGTATVSLRGLGVNRNLVLINGRRMTAGSPGGGSDAYAADLNQIPTPLIQRVELLTGGASAVYGSDAISGVVNFIMKDNFEGVQIDFNHSFYNHQQQNPHGIADLIRARAVANPTQYVVPTDVASDGDIHNISLLLGKNFADNKGNATVFFNYKREDPVLQAARDFSACATGQGATFSCRGTDNSNSFFLNGGNGPLFTTADAAGNARPYLTATDRFNFAPYNYYQRPSEQYGFAAFAHLDVTPGVRAYTEFNFHDNHTIAQIAPSGIFLGNPDFFLPARPIRFENPLLTASWRAVIAANNSDPTGAIIRPFAAPGDVAEMLIGRRNIEGGGRQDDIRHSSFRWVLGMKGEIWKDWNYDLFLQTGKVLYQEVYRNDFSKQRIARAMDVVTDPATGNAVCRSVLDGSDLNCVPYNVWRVGGVTPAALAYLQTPGLKNGHTQQQVQGGTLSADLGNYGWRLPTAKNGVGVVFGAERRKEALVLDTDVEFSSFDLAGQGGPTLPVSGKVTATDVFGEVRVPLIEGRQFADLLSVNGSYRLSRYNTGIRTNTHGVGVEWAPVQNYRLRGGYQRAVRAANIVELFQPQGNNLLGLTDPCSALTVAAGSGGTAAQCANSGMTAAQYGAAGSVIADSAAGQYNILQGGNAALAPEKSDSYTAGLVFTPTKNLTGTIDWWSIKIAGAVGTIPAQQALNLCVFSNQFCNLIQRDALGTLWVTPAGRVVSTNQNLGGYLTTGVDLAVNYLLRLGSWGSLNLNGQGTYTTKWEAEPIKGQGKFDCAGLYGNQCTILSLALIPKWRHRVRATWSTPWNLDLAATWRHIDEIKAETTSGNSILAGATPNTDRQLDKRDYLDLVASWTVDRSLTVRAGVNNVFDKDPPIVSSIIADPAILGNGNTFPQMYDTLGRLVFISATLKW